MSKLFRLVEKQKVVNTYFIEADDEQTALQIYTHSDLEPDESDYVVTNIHITLEEEDDDDSNKD